MEQGARAREQEKHREKPNEKDSYWFALTLAPALCDPVWAQQPAKIPRIALLGAASASIVAARVEAFREGLRELGYLEGKNIIIEYRFGEGKSNEVTSLAVELARSKVDVIVTAGPAATRSAKEATATIPIVMGNEGDPVGSGFVASLARPGGNITGCQISPQ